MPLSRRFARELLLGTELPDLARWTGLRLAILLSTISLHIATPGVDVDGALIVLQLTPPDQ